MSDHTVTVNQEILDCLELAVDNLVMVANMQYSTHDEQTLMDVAAVLADAFGFPAPPEFDLSNEQDGTIVLTPLNKNAKTNKGPQLRLVESTHEHSESNHDNPEQT